MSSVMEHEAGILTAVVIIPAAQHRNLKGISMSFSAKNQGYSVIVQISRVRDLTKPFEFGGLNLFHLEN